MPKKQIIGSIFIIVILSFICIYIYDNYKIESKTSIIIKSKDLCKNSLVKYYTDNKNNNYYLYCIDDVIIDYTDRTLELNKALEAKQIEMSFLFDNSKKNNIKGQKIIEYRNNNYSVISCKKTDGTYNYIIGSKEMGYKESFCGEEPYTCSFIKTYLVLDISKSKSSDYVYLTVRNELDEEVETVKIEKKYTEGLKENNYYKFSFGSTNDNSKESIKNIFENSIILDASLVESINNQINDKECE